MALFFGPAQAILADPDRQSAKFLAVMGQMEPLPRVAQAPWILIAGLFGIACIHAPSIIYGPGNCAAAASAASRCSAACSGLLYLSHCACTALRAQLYATMPVTMLARA